MPSDNSDKSFENDDDIRRGRGAEEEDTYAVEGMKSGQSDDEDNIIIIAEGTSAARSGGRR